MNQPEDSSVAGDGAGVRDSHRRRTWVLVGAGLAVVVVAVGMAVSAEPDAPTSGNDGFPLAVSSYDGPLSAPGRYGAAGRAIDCLHPPTGSNAAQEIYSEGATSGSPRAAVDTAMSEGLFLDMPAVDLALAAKEPDRRLLTFEVNRKVLLALVVRHGPATEGAGGDGWYVETFARCDLAEFPAEQAKIAGLGKIGIWTDESGTPIPIAKVYSGHGPEHCSWQNMTFLYLGDGGQGRSYVEAPIPDLRRVVTGPYRRDVALPDDARDTGWLRDGRRLWLSSDGSYAYVGTAGSVDAWPRFEAGCA